jgi:glycosyltransferase involved in cell wall biosynthesis
MHIALVNRWYPPHSGFGGVAAYNHYLAHALVELGHRATVVAARWSHDAPEYHEDAGVTVHRLLSRHHYRLHRLPIVGRYVRPLRHLLYSLQIDRKLRELEAQDRPDAVEFAEVGAEGFVYLLRVRRCPAVVRCHTPTFVLRRYYTSAEMPYDTSLTTMMEKRCIRRADALTAPSNDMARTVARQCGIEAGRVSVIPNALDAALFSDPPPRSPGGAQSRAESVTRTSEDLTVLHVGRMHRVKGVEVLAHAIPQVLEEVPQARFLFIGHDRPDGRGSTWQQRLVAYFHERGVGESVHFLGAVDQPTLLGWYRQADIAVVPSMLYESFSYTCAQAMAAGVPVVASAIGGIPETVDNGVSGLLVGPGEVGELAQAIVRLAHDPGLRQRMGQTAAMRARERFDASRVAQQFLLVVQTLARDRSEAKGSAGVR